MTEKYEGNKYRRFIGTGDMYDTIGAMQFNILTLLGLRENHTLLDIGCGSLRVGRLFLMYLKSGNYYGIEPNMELVEQAIDHETGHEIIEMKKPQFNDDANFTLTIFNTQFDYILAQSILTHTDESQTRRCLEEVKKALKPDGIFAATYLVGDESFKGQGWQYPDVSTYRQEDMEQFVLDSGLYYHEIGYPHPNDHMWIAITHEKDNQMLQHLQAHAENVNLIKQLQYAEQRLEVAQNKREHAYKQLESLRNNPYVKFGRTIKQLLSLSKPKNSG